MAAFSYAALDPSGREQRGIVEADSSRQVRQVLRDRGLAPLRIEPAVTRGSTGESGLRLGAADLALFTRQLATLLQAGMPLEEVLTAVLRQTDSARLRRVVSAVRSRVLEGHALAQSLAEFPRAFPALYRATVAAGEHAGHLDKVLMRLADHTEYAHAARQKVRLALLYPALLLITAIGIVTALMAFVVPDVVAVFVAQGQTLPVLTRTLIAGSDLIVQWGWLLLVLIVIAVSLSRYALSRESVALRWHRQLLRWPLLGRLLRSSNSARYAGTLSVLGSAGVPLVEGMAIASEVLDNLWLRQHAREATQLVKEGGSLHQALGRDDAFPPMMIHMIASGELSGTLDQMLDRVAEAQQRDFDQLVATTLGLLEPAVLLLMGGAVLVIVLAILQPIFALNQLI